MSDLEKSKVRLKIRKELDEIDEYQHHSKSLGVCKSILEINIETGCSLKSAQKYPILILSFFIFFYVI